MLLCPGRMELSGLGLILKAGGPFCRTDVSCTIWFPHEEVSGGPYLHLQLSEPTGGPHDP
jgi:hypothetical protein